MVSIASIFFSFGKEMNIISPYYASLLKIISDDCTSRLDTNFDEEKKKRGRFCCRKIFFPGKNYFPSFKMELKCTCWTQYNRDCGHSSLVFIATKNQK